MAQHDRSCISFSHEVLSGPQVSVEDSFSVLLGLKLTEAQPSSACGFKMFLLRAGRENNLGGVSRGKCFWAPPESDDRHSHSISYSLVT